MKVVDTIISLPLIQDLEILVEISVVMDQHRRAIGIYKTLVKVHYKKPMDGEFNDVTAFTLKGITSSTVELETNTVDSIQVVAVFVNIFAEFSEQKVGAPDTPPTLGSHFLTTTT